jgi:hypothetical protein
MDWQTDGDVLIRKLVNNLKLMKMKKYSLILGFLISNFAFAQLGIGLTQTSNASVSMQFGTENRGIILPWVENETSLTDAVDGTIVYDASDFKVKVKTPLGWKDLSIDETGTTVNPISNVDGLLIQSGLPEIEESKVGVGDENSTPGILVLENSNQAMVLPKVASPHLNILNPSPGLMVYDTVSSQLAVFNGTVWTYWKP